MTPEEAKRRLEEASEQLRQADREYAMAKTIALAALLAVGLIALLLEIL